MSKKHLGGHAGVTHVDRGVIELLNERLNPKTMIDVGCGPGGMTIAARELGIECYGIDGDFDRLPIFEVAPSWMIKHDYQDGPAVEGREFDLCWSCEFVEHVYDKYLPFFASDFARCKFVALTYAPPGAPGAHHVNTNTQEYWVEQLAEYGLEYDEEFTQELRQASTMKRDFFRKHGLFFRRK